MGRYIIAQFCFISRSVKNVFFSDHTVELS